MAAGETAGAAGGVWSTGARRALATGVISLSTRAPIVGSPGMAGCDGAPLADQRADVEDDAEDDDDDVDDDDDAEDDERRGSAVGRRVTVAGVGSIGTGVVSTASSAVRNSCPLAGR